MIFVEARETEGNERAEVVIAGGWGIGSKEDWQWVEELALRMPSSWSP